MNKKLLYKVSVFYACIGLFLLVGMGAFYVNWPGFYDHGEVNMASVSWLLENGKPLYTELDASTNYSLEHGPVIYLATAAMYHFLGASVLTAKLPGYLALLAGLLISFWGFARKTGWQRAFCLLGIEAWVLLKWPFVFMNRDDSFMLLCVAAGFFFADRLRGPGHRWGMALALGVLINLKIHGGIYFLPVLVLYAKNHGWKNLLYVLGFSIFVVALPFLFPAISFWNYIGWLQQAAIHGFSGKLLLENITYTLLLAAMFWTVGELCRVRWKNFINLYKEEIIACFVAALCVNIVGAKHGSGNYHLIPLIPVWGYFISLLLQEIPDRNRSGNHRKTGAIVFVVLLLLAAGSGINSERRLWEKMQNHPELNKIVAEIRDMEKFYQGKTIEIGYGGDRHYGEYRQFIPLLVFDGHPYLVDSATLMDTRLSGLKMSPAALRALEDGTVQIWLIPHGAEPFSLHSYYHSSQFVFEEDFRNIFRQNYALVKQGQYFDVWAYQGLK